MKSLIKAIVFFGILQFSISSRAQSTADTLAIQTILQEQVESWNKGDAKTYSLHFAEDGTFTNILGLYYTGHKEFLDRVDLIFNGAFKGTKMIQNDVSLKFVTPGVAIVETIIWVHGFSPQGSPEGTYLDDNGNLRTRLLQVMVKDGENWEIAAFHNIDIKPGIPSPKPN